MKIQLSEIALSLCAGLAIACSGIALTATQAFAGLAPMVDIFWWLWRLVGGIIGLVA
jgi:hypothetical protein